MSHDKIRMAIILGGAVIFALSIVIFSLALFGVAE